MRILLLLAATTVVMLCGIADVGPEIKNFSAYEKDGRKENNRQSRPKMLEIMLTKNISDMKELLGKQQPPREQGKKMKENSERPWDYDQNLEKLNVEIKSERSAGPTLIQRDTSLTETHADEILEDVGRRALNKRQVFKDETHPLRTWYDGVFYMFNTSDHVITKAFKMGAKIWSEATCIDFAEDKNAKDKVVVNKEVGCSSNIGRIGGDQCLSVGVQPKPLETIQFEIANSNFTDVCGLTYDYGSVMHYEETSFSMNNRPTMIAKDPYYQKTMGSEIISFSDISTINQHYGCNEKCNKSTSAKCANEGYPHPRDCSICICPSGYGGVLCDRRPSGCGEDLVAAPKKKILDYTLGFGSGLRDEFDFCYYLIAAPVKKRIELEIYSITNGYDEAGCRSGGVEVKAQKDQKMTGYRFCSMKGSGGPIVSSSNRLPVIYFNRLSRMRAIVMYRYID